MCVVSWKRIAYRRPVGELIEPRMLHQRDGLVLTYRPEAARELLLYSSRFTVRVDLNASASVEPGERFTLRLRSACCGAPVSYFTEGERENVFNAEAGPLAEWELELLWPFSEPGTWACSSCRGDALPLEHPSDLMVSSYQGPEEVRRLLARWSHLGGADFLEAEVEAGELYDHLLELFKRLAYGMWLNYEDASLASGPGVLTRPRALVAACEELASEVDPMPHPELFEWEAMCAACDCGGSVAEHDALEVVSR